MNEEAFLSEAMRNLLEFGKEGAKDFNDTLDKMFETATFINPLAPSLTLLSATMKSTTIEGNMNLMKELMELSENEVVQASIKGFSKILEYILEGSADVLDTIDKKLDKVWTLFSGIKDFITMDATDVSEHWVNIDAFDDQPELDNLLEEGTSEYIELVVEGTLSLLQGLSDGISWLGNLFG